MEDNGNLIFHLLTNIFGENLVFSNHVVEIHPFMLKIYMFIMAANLHTLLPCLSYGEWANSFICGQMLMKLSI
jgi:hypothetical protein